MKRYWRWLAVAGLTAIAGSALAGQQRQELSPAAQQLVSAALAGLQGETLIDCHAHLAGLGTDGSGAAVRPELRSVWHPAQWLRFRTYLTAAGVRNEAHADSEYLAVLAARARALPVRLRLCVFAFDHAYRPDGSVDTNAAPYYVPNDYALRATRAYPDIFIPVASVHPYRADAVAELDRCAAAGVRLVKWLPNVQNIDPADTRCLPFYRALVRNRMALITHGGDENAFGGTVQQAYGNPLRLRAALDAGCTVIVAHCAAEGEGEDLDAPAGADGRRPRAANLALFLRLLDGTRYRGRVYGDLSSLTQLNHAQEALPTLLAHPELHDRLINGSDYPLPGVDTLNSSYYLAAHGYLTWHEARLLEEIQRANPLLYDIVLKRTLRDPQSGARLPAAVFGTTMRRAVRQ